jgi:hypothetical protein
MAHINLLGEYDFSDESCGIASESDPQSRPPKEVKNFGAAEPRYVLQSPGLLENCVGLYVPLLEFNQILKHHLPHLTRQHCLAVVLYTISNPRSYNIPEPCYGSPP